MEISRSIIHAVGFFQTAFTIILALALGEALKQFVVENDERPMHWDRLPSLISFLLIIVPFFQGMSQHLFETYLNAPTVPKFYAGFLMFDGVMFMIESAFFFVMSRALAPKHWRRYFYAVLLLLLVDTVWAVVTLMRGIHVGIWIYLNAVLAAVLLAVLWWERGKPVSLRPALICMATVLVTTTVSYIAMRSIYFG